MKAHLSGLFCGLLALSFAPTVQSQCSWDYSDLASPPPFGSLVGASTTWDPDGAGPLQERVACAGFFAQANGVPAMGVAAFDPQAQTWLPVGSGFGFELAGIHGGSNGRLIVGGGVPVSFSVILGRVGLWDGQAWQTLPDLNGFVSAVIEMPNGDIIASGDFTAAGGVPARGFARWDGSSWNAMPGANAPDTGTRALVVSPSGNLIAGTLIGGNQPFGSGQLSSWDGSAWTRLDAGSGVTSIAILALDQLPNGDIIAGGAFLFPQAGAIRMVARWNGSDWVDLGPGFDQSDGVVVAVQHLPNGDIAVGGAFASAGGVPATHVARFDGTSWSALGGGIGFPNTSNQVQTLSVLNGTLYAGGAFGELQPLGQQNFAALDLGCLGGTTVGIPFCASNPTSVGGSANLEGQGSATVSANSLVLAASGMPSNQFGFFVLSKTAAPPVTPPTSDGNICLGGNIGRLNAPSQILNSGSSGAFSLALDLTSVPQGSGTVPIVAGETWFFQAWFRDVNSMGMNTSNFTDGLEIAFL